MRDVTGVNFREMNEAARVELIVALMGEAIEMEHTDESITAGLQAILRVPDGTPLQETLTEEDDDTPDDELTDAAFVDRMIYFHFGTMVL